MKRWLCAVLAAVLLAAAGCREQVPPADEKQPLETVALYAWRYDRAKGAFWKACGYNTVQLIDLGWYYNAETALDEYVAGVTEQIAQAQADGFRVNVLLMNNIEQWHGPGDREPTGFGVLYDPADAAKTEERLQWLERNIEAWKQADSFSLMAADPGGVTAGMEGSGSRYFAEMAKRLREIVRAHAPHAAFNVNTWAIARCDVDFCDYAAAYEQPEYWLRMDQMAAEVAAAIADTDIGIELTAQDYYQRVTLNVFDRCYPEKEQFPLYPTAADIAPLRDGKRNVWAWPYFFVDTITDTVEIGTRYMHRFVQQMRAIGVNGLVADYSDTGYHAHAVNTYAIARFCNDAAATPEQVLDEYAALIADGETCGTLAQILRFIENNSVYQTYPTEKSHLPPLETEIVNAAQALAKMKHVVPRTEGSPLLTQSPQEVCRMLTARLEQLKNG